LQLASAICGTPSQRMLRVTWNDRHWFYRCPFSDFLLCVQLCKCVGLIMFASCVISISFSCKPACVYSSGFGVLGLTRFHSNWLAFQVKHWLSFKACGFPNPRKDVVLEPDHQKIGGSGR